MKSLIHYCLSIFVAFVLAGVEANSYLSYLRMFSLLHFYSTAGHQQAEAFAPRGASSIVSSLQIQHHRNSAAVIPSAFDHEIHRSIRTSLPASSGNNDEEFYTLTESGQLALGIAGTLAALIVFYSEFTLKTTGCGVPAGPFGLFGLTEGFSYLGVTGMAAYSLVTKIKTGSGLPAGPGGLLGAAEGLSFLAIVVGLVVLALQVTDYGYIPNALPTEGGICR